jgi:hypothetical protein
MISQHSNADSQATSITATTTGNLNGGGGGGGGAACNAAIGHGTILCCKKNSEFHFVINNRNIQGLCVNGKFLKEFVFIFFYRVFVSFL